MKSINDTKTENSKIECDEVCFLEKLDQSEDYKKEVKKLKSTKQCRC
jgi:hypothetical protein